MDALIIIIVVVVCIIPLLLNYFFNKNKQKLIFIIYLHASRYYGYMDPSDPCCEWTNDFAVIPLCINFLMHK